MHETIETKRTSEEIIRERIHFDKHIRYLLNFIELDGSDFRRWVISCALKTWDRQMAFLQPEWIRHRDVLDVGCGHPRMLFYFKQLQARQMVGIDLSRQFVNRGLRRDYSYVHGVKVANCSEEIRFVYGDVNDGELYNTRVDTITCFQALHHLDINRFIETCHRLLKPNGLVIISDPVGDHPLRRIGDCIGRTFGLLSRDEQALPPRLVVDRFQGQGFKLVLNKSLNPLLEIYFLMTEMLLSSFPRLALYSKIPMALLRPLENFLEATLLDRFPRLGWRYFLVFRLPDRDECQVRSVLPDSKP